MFIPYAHNMRHTFAYPVVAGIPNIGSRSTQGRALNSARQWRLRQAISSRTWCFPCWEPSPLLSLSVLPEAYCWVCACMAQAN